MTDKKSVHLSISAMALTLFLPFLGNFHLFDWDEINFAESAREMLQSGEYFRVQIGFEPFWEKPPLFIWLQALSMKLFGVNEFAARFPNVICGIITLNILYHFGRKVLSHFAGIFWAIAYAGSIAPFLYTQSGIIDPVFNLFILLSIYQLFQAESARQNSEKPRIHYLLSGLFAGLAVLTKGPVALLLIGLVGFLRWLSNSKHASPGLTNSMLFLGSALLVSSLWIVPEWMKNGPHVLGAFLEYQMDLFKGQIEWHNQPWFYHILVLLLLCFPASVFALPHLVKNTSYSGTEKLFSTYMRTTFWVVLIVFSVVSTKIIHYSSLCWIPLSWFAAITLYRKHTNRGAFPRWTYLPYLLILLIISGTISFVCLSFTNAHFQNIFFNLGNLNKYRFLLDSPIGFSGYEWVIPFIYLVISVFWVLKNSGNNKSNPAHLFVFTLVFSIFFRSYLLPKFEYLLQGKYIESIESNKGKNLYMESWGYKTYAIYYYGNLSKKEFSGNWLKNSNSASKLQSAGEARRIYLSDQIVEKPVLIYTRFNFEPDYYFKEKFKLIHRLGLYSLWERKDITKPDMRINP